MGSKSEKQGIKGIGSLLRQDDIDLAKQTRKKLSYDALIPNEENHYSIKKIDELADLIEDVGLLQDLLVKPIGNNKYKIIAGHRRHAAIRLLVEIRGLDRFRLIDCRILEKDEKELITQYKLHASNVYRDLTEYEKMMMISELKEIIKGLKEDGVSIKGKVRDIIASDTGLSPVQVQRYMTLAEHADEETTDKLKDQEISMIDAYNVTMEKKNTDVPVRKKNPTTAPLNDSQKLIKNLKPLKKFGEERDLPKLIDMVKEIEEYLMGDECCNG